MPKFSEFSFPTFRPFLPSLLLIPSGIGCEIGGYAGDAIPFARLLASVSGCLITHPNVMNGASLYWSDQRIQYVEGFSIDQFAAGKVFLKPVRQQKIGLLFDKAIEPEILQRQLQVVDGCRASLGLDIGPVVTTEAPLQISINQGTSGASWGRLLCPDALLRAGEKLKEQGATAIAVITRFPDNSLNEEVENYRKGKGVDLMAGAEAVISHLLVRHLSMPCAHAPALSALPIASDLDPRAAGEEIGYTFLPCVLVGLSRAPDLVLKDRLEENKIFENTELLSVEQLGAVVAPEGALGGEAVFSCIERNIPLIVVSNQSVLDVGIESLGLNKYLQSKYKVTYIEVDNYMEAAGCLSALREGISLDSLKRPVQSVKQIIDS